MMGGQIALVIILHCTIEAMHNMSLGCTFFLLQISVCMYCDDVHV